MYAVINKSENIFKRKKDSSAYYVKDDADNIYYNVFFYVDMEMVLRKKIKGIAAYATNLPSENSYVNSTSIFEKLNLSSADTSVGAIINYEKIDMANQLFIDNDIPRAYITLVDPKVNFDKYRYKHNRGGTEIEKFGAELKKVVNFKNQPPGIDMTGTILSDKQPGPQPGALESVRRRVVSEGLKNGRGLIEIMSYGKMKRKSRRDSHLITDQEQEEKEYRKNKEVLAEDNNLFSQFESGLVRNDIEESIDLIKRSRKVMKLNIVIKIPKKRLASSGVKPSNFYLAFEALDVTGAITLDTNLVEINYDRDKKYSKMSLKGLELKGSTSSNKEKSFLVASGKKNSMRVDFYHKCISSDLPLLSNPFYTAGSTLLTESRNRHELQLSRRAKRSQMAGVSYLVPRIFSSTQIMRATPTISGVSFDNCVEAAVEGFHEGKLNTIPFHVLISPSTNSKAQRNKIIVNISEIDPDIHKIRPVKKRITAAAYSDSRNYKPIVDKDGQLVTFTKLDKDTLGKILKFYDYDVQDSEVYDYRLEIVRKPRNTSRTFSSNNFIDKYEKPDGSINLLVNSKTFSKDRVTFNITATVSEDFKTSAYGIIQALEKPLGDNSITRALFSDEIQEVKNSSQVAIVLIVERIDNATGQATFLENLYGNQNGDGSYTFGIVDNIIEDEYSTRSTLSNQGYTYKFVPCSAPVAEVLSAVRSELQLRTGTQVGKKLNLYKFSNLKENLSKVDTKVLSEVSNKFSRSFKSHVLVDAETQTARNNGNVLAASSTGDVLYENTGPLASKMSPSTSVSPGLVKFKKGKILYYPCLKETKQPVNKFNNTKMSHKFIIEFFAYFKEDIDHAVIFSMSNNKLNYECTIHTDYSKENYRALVEKNSSGQNFSFYLYCVKNTGKVLSPVFLGSYAT